MATTTSSRREAAGQWWQLRSRNERIVLSAGAGLLALALAWLFVWQPLMADTERLTRQLGNARVTLAESRRQADEIAGLARNPPQVAAGEPRAALDAMLAEQGLKGSGTTIERIDDGRIRITFDAIAFDALTAFLEALQRTAQLRAVDLVATARVEPGQVRAEVTLAR